MPLFGYPGGKAKMFGHIAPFIFDLCHGEKDLEYREPFAGGLGLLAKMLYKLWFHRLWINDLDPSIACLWTSVMRFPEELAKRILEFTPSVDAFLEFRKAIRQLSSVPDNGKAIIDYGFKKLALQKMSHRSAGRDVLGGIKQEGKLLVRRCWHPGPLVHNLWQWHRKLVYFQPRDNRCSSYDFTRLIEDELCRAVLYLDPPYFQPFKQHYPFTFEEKDHLRLASALKATSHKWVLSYDDVPQIKDLYSWAKCRPIKTTYTMKAEVVEGNELIITRN
jgi:DNA adenine methylase